MFFRFLNSIFALSFPTDRLPAEHQTRQPQATESSYISHSRFRIQGCYLDLQLWIAKHSRTPIGLMSSIEINQHTNNTIKINIGVRLAINWVFVPRDTCSFIHLKVACKDTMHCVSDNDKHPFSLACASLCSYICPCKFLRFWKPQKFKKLSENSQ